METPKFDRVVSLLLLEMFSKNIKIEDINKQVNLLKEIFPDNKQDIDNNFLRIYTSHIKDRICSYTLTINDLIVGVDRISDLAHIDTSLLNVLKDLESILRVQKTFNQDENNEF